MCVDGQKFNKIDPQTLQKCDPYIAYQQHSFIYLWRMDRCIFFPHKLSGGVAEKKVETREWKSLKQVHIAPKCTIMLYWTKYIKRREYPGHLTVWLVVRKKKEWKILFSPNTRVVHMGMQSHQYSAEFPSPALDMWLSPILQKFIFISSSPDGFPFEIFAIMDQKSKYMEIFLRKVPFFNSEK